MIRIPFSPPDWLFRIGLSAGAVWETTSPQADPRHGRLVITAATLPIRKDSLLAGWLGPRTCWPGSVRGENAATGLIPASRYAGWLQNQAASGIPYVYVGHAVQQVRWVLRRPRSKSP